MVALFGFSIGFGVPIFLCWTKWQPFCLKPLEIGTKWWPFWNGLEHSYSYCYDWSFQTPSIGNRNFKTFGIPMFGIQAPIVTGIVIPQRRPQNFVLWPSPMGRGGGEQFRVYRSPQPILTKTNSYKVVSIGVFIAFKVIFTPLKYKYAHILLFQFVFTKYVITTALFLSYLT